MERTIDYHPSDLAVIVVNFGSSNLLAENLTAVSSAIPEAAIVVVDNFSSRAEREKLETLAAAHGWSVVLLPSNEGFGAGMNVGVARAAELGSKFYLLLNPDATIDADSITALAERVAESPMTMVSPVVTRPDGAPWFAGSDLYLADGRIRSRRRRGEAPSDSVMTWLSGACLLVSQALWQVVGGFDERYFLYWEDVDLSWKVHQAGGELAVVHSASAVHAEGGTQKSKARKDTSNRKSNAYYYFNIRNRLVFASLRLSPIETDVWKKNSRTIAWEILRQGGRRQFLTSLSPLWAAFQGLRAGLTMARSIQRTRDEEES